MLFTSHLFIFAFFPASCVFVFLMNKFFGKTAAVLAMTLASLVFYQFNGQAELPILLASILGNHILITLTARSSNSRTKYWLTFSLITANVGALVYYKYFTFLNVQFESLRYVYENHFPIREWYHRAAWYQSLYPWGEAGVIITLPLGISFFTFQQIAYILDLRAGRVKEHRFLDYIFCVTFYPHLIAGPIVNYRELIPQLWKKSILSFRNINLISGLAVFAIGLAKKAIIADTVGEIANLGFDHPDKIQGLGFAGAWITILAYTFQIYFDFSGYSDMAIGLARVFGIDLPINFASPYKSKSIIQFWQTWHITLSRFLKQYVYIPLGGNRHGSLARYRNLFLTMLIGGIWHGAGWTFLIWGALHGFFLSVNHLWRAWGRRLPDFPAQVATFLCVILAWVFFRASNLKSALLIIRESIRIDSILSSEITWSWKHGVLLVAAALAFAAPSTQEIMSRYNIGIPPENMKRMKSNWFSWRATVPWLILTTVVAAVACFYETDFPKFLYWDF